MKDKIQRFGAAMFLPVLLFPAAGMLLGLTVLMLNRDLFPFAVEGSTWVKVVNIFLEASLVVFKNLPLIFVLGLPIALAKKAPGRAVLASFISYFTFNYFIGGILREFGDKLGVVYETGTPGLTEVGGVLTLDTSILGAIIVASITVWVQNKYFDKELPDWLQAFRGTPLVTIVCFPLMLLLAVTTVFVWPSIQAGITGVQTFMLSSGVIGVWLFTFLERILIPTGLHHFVYGPVFFGPVAVDGGTINYWVQNMQAFADSNESLRILFPQGGLMLTGMGKIFGTTGAAIAMYVTSRPENKKKVFGLLFSALITAILTGITEPIEFTFLFIAPQLFALHAFLSATMAAVTYLAGITGNFQTGLIDFIFQNWLPLIRNHGFMYLVQIGIGLSFVGIYFVLFKAIILKYNILTPGRGEENDEEIKLTSKEEYKKAKAGINKDKELALNFLEGFGGVENIDSVTSCATRLRVKVKDPSIVKSAEFFRKGGAVNLVEAGENFQVIVGLSVPVVREEFEKLMNS